MSMLFHHHGAYFDGKKSICSYCGTELQNSLLSETPCTVRTAYYIQIDLDYDRYGDLSGCLLFIDVYNFVPHLRAAVIDKGSMKCFDLEIDPDCEDELNEAMLAAVSEQGSISTSGHYSLTKPLLSRVSVLIKKGKIKRRRV